MPEGGTRPEPEAECLCGCIVWEAHETDLPDPGNPGFLDLGVLQRQAEAGRVVWRARVRTTRFGCDSLREIEVRPGAVERLVRARYQQTRMRLRRMPVTRSVTMFGRTVYYLGFTYPPWGPWNREETEIDEADFLRQRGLSWCVTAGIGC